VHVAAFHTLHQVDDQDWLLTIRFVWKRKEKRITSLTIGTSPEFELALYTLCFLDGNQDNRMTIGRYEVNVK
jgi:poly(U)-specific endoribonuclease